MEKLIEYTSSDNIKGYLEVVKVYADGREEIHFSDKNVITSGMGATLLRAFSTNAPGAVGNFQIVNFQVGLSGNSALQVSSTGSLSGALSSTDQYGVNASVETVTANSESSGVTASGIFGVIPWAYIKKLTATRVLFHINIDENTCNGLTLNEIGLFSNNPLMTTPTKTKMLCAYRYFTALAKQDSFGVSFRWVIEF